MRIYQVKLNAKLLGQFGSLDVCSGGAKTQPQLACGGGTRWMVEKGLAWSSGEWCGVVMIASTVFINGVTYCISIRGRLPNACANHMDSSSSPNKGTIGTELVR